MIFRFTICSLAVLFCLRTTAQSIGEAPLRYNPHLTQKDTDRPIGLRVNGYSETVTLFKGETVNLCADTARLDHAFDQLSDEQCETLQHGSLLLNGHCIEFTAGDVTQDREQRVCISLRDSTGNTLTWTVIFDIRAPREIPFAEDFYEEGHRPDPSKWLDREVFVNNTLAKDPVSIGLATFDGIDENGRPYGGGQVYGDSLTSTYIDLDGLTAGDRVYLTFWIQAGGLGRGFGANPADSLFLEFKHPDGTWEQVFSSAGTDQLDAPPFAMQTVRVLPQFFQEGFQFRFYNHSDLEGITDLWQLDYLKLSLDNDPDSFERDISFTRPPSSLLDPYTSMPWKHFTGNETKYTRDSIRIELYGHFEQTALADSSRLSVRERSTGIQVLPFETLLEVPPFVDENQPNVDYGPHAYLNPIKNTDLILNSLENDFDPAAEGYTFLNTYSFIQAQEVLEEWQMNNTVRRETHFGNYFAYDDGTAESGVYLTPGQEGDPMAALEFTAETGDTLRGLHMLLPHVQAEDMDQQISLFVWTGALDSEPIYRENFISPVFPDQYYDSLGGFTTYSLKSPTSGKDTSLYIPPGKFYVGWQQHTVFNEVGMYVGLDKNSPDGAGYTWFNGGEGWIPLKEANASITGSIMIRPVFGDRVLHTTETGGPMNIEQVALYPNPGNGLFSLEQDGSWGNSTFYRVFSRNGMEVASGRVIGGTLDVRHLDEGLYFVRLYRPQTGIRGGARIIISKGN